MILLPQNLATLANLTADQTRFNAMGCVRVTETETGYRAEATNGCVAAIVTGPAPADPAEFPVQPGPEDNGAKAGFVPAAEWKAAFKATCTRKRGFVKPAWRNVAASFAVDAAGETVTARATLAATDGTAQHVARSAVDNPRFPPVDDVIPTDEPAACVAVDPVRLAELLRVAAGFGDRVTIELHGAKPVAIRAKNAEGQEFTGLIVPIT